MLRIEAACGCSKGNIRENNEDNFFFGGTVLDQDNCGLNSILSLTKSISSPEYFGVFDGMGGETNGEEAAYIAAKTLAGRVRFKRAPVDVADILREANGKICQRSTERGGKRMGSTAVVLAIAPSGAKIVNIGDSKAFLYRAGELSQLSVDHTDKALIEASGAAGRKPRLMQHLGIEPEEMRIEPYSCSLEMCSRDIFLLSSDGLTDMVPPERIELLLSEGASPEKTAEKLIALALAKGGRDNITVILCHISEV